MALTVRVGSVTLSVEDAPLEARLNQLETDGVPGITREDIRMPVGVQDQALQDALLRQAVVAAYVDAGRLAPGRQASAFGKLLQVHGVAQRFQESVHDWQQRGRPLDGASGHLLTLKESDCVAQRYSNVPGHGSFTEEAIGRLVIDVALVALGLANAQQADVLDAHPQALRTKNSCHLNGAPDQAITGLTYNAQAIPPSLRAPMQQLVEWIIPSTQWLLSFDGTACVHETPDPRDLQSMSDFLDYFGAIGPQPTRYAVGTLSGFRDYRFVPMLSSVTPGTMSQATQAPIPQCQSSLY